MAAISLCRLRKRAVQNRAGSGLADRVEMQHGRKGAFPFALKAARHRHPPSSMTGQSLAETRPALPHWRMQDAIAHQVAREETRAIHQSVATRPRRRPTAGWQVAEPTSPCRLLEVTSETRPFGNPGPAPPREGLAAEECRGHAAGWRGTPARGNVLEAHSPGRMGDGLPAAFCEWHGNVEDSRNVFDPRIDAVPVTLRAIRHRKQAGASRRDRLRPQDGRRLHAGAQPPICHPAALARWLHSRA